MATGIKINIKSKIFKAKLNEKSFCSKTNLG